MNISRTSIGLAVKAARQAAHLSLSELAQKTEINISSLSRVESGLRALDFSEAIVLAKELRVNLDHFKDLAKTYEENGTVEKIIKNRDLINALKKAHQLAILTAIEAGT